MSLKRDIQGIVKNTMTLLKGFELHVPINYSLVGSVVYDPVSGLSTPSITTYPSVTAVLTTFSADEKTEDVVVITDRKALISFLDLPYVLTPNDYFVDINTNERWEVKKILGFPGEPMHKLHVRKT